MYKLQEESILNSYLGKKLNSLYKGKVLLEILQFTSVNRNI